MQGGGRNGDMIANVFLVGWNRREMGEAVPVRTVARKLAKRKFSQEEQENRAVPTDPFNRRFRRWRRCRTAKPDI